MAAAADLRNGLPVGDIADGNVQDWFAQARRSVLLEACVRNATARDLAFTLSLAIVGEESALFGQVGDGAIVVPDDGGYRVPLWPETGEYLNTTYFLTDDDYREHLRVARHSGRVDELALITDGLELLALKLAAREVKAAFFRPLFSSLHRTPCVRRYRDEMTCWLDSPQVNARTDDDKTLVLACRT